MMYAVNVGHYESVGLSKKDSTLIERTFGLKTYLFSDSGKYTIRVGTVSDQLKAEGIVSHLKRLGLDAYYVQPKQVS